VKENTIMAELMTDSVDLPRIGGWGRSDRSVALKHKLVLGVIGAMLGALLAGCTADKTPSKEETSLANAAKDVIIPLEAGRMKNPLPESDEVVSQGQQAFVESCAICHGGDGRGGTSIGSHMDPPAMDLTSAHVQHWSDGEQFWIIQNGVRLTGMPAWKSSVSDDNTWKLTRFIHNLPRLDAVSASPNNSPVTGPSACFRAGQVHPQSTERPRVL
jgi:mono/diheme cytochrome c family protein